MQDAAMALAAAAALQGLNTLQVMMINLALSLPPVTLIAFP